MDGTTLLSLVVGAMAAFVVWALVDRWLVEPRRAASTFAALARATGRAPVHEDEYLSRLDLQVEGRDVVFRSQFVGSGGDSPVRGERGHVWVTATRLRPRGWEMHDLQVRQRRPRAARWESRFAIVESGVPVRDGWCTDAVREAIASFYDHPLAIGTTRVDRGELQHVGYWSKVRGADDAATVREFAARFADLAGVLERTAVRLQPPA